MNTAKKRLLLLGDSLFEFGNWNALLPDFFVMNRGIAGETLGELSWRLADELMESPGQDAIVLQSGTNDVWNQEPTYPAVWHTFLPRLRALADCPIVVCGLAPGGLAPLARIRELNQEVARLAERTADCVFLDLVPPLLAAREADPAHPLFLGDGVHFSAAGYKVWASALNACLRELFDGRP